MAANTEDAGQVEQETEYPDTPESPDGFNDYSTPPETPSPCHDRSFQLVNLLSGSTRQLSYERGASVGWVVSQIKKGIRESSSEHAQISDEELKLIHTRSDGRLKMLKNLFLPLDDLFEGYADADRVIRWSRVTAARDMEERACLDVS